MENYVAMIKITEPLGLGSGNFALRVILFRSVVILTHFLNSCSFVCFVSFSVAPPWASGPSLPVLIYPYASNFNSAASSPCSQKLDCFQKCKSEHIIYLLKTSDGSAALADEDQPL